MRALYSIPSLRFMCLVLALVGMVCAQDAAALPRADAELQAAQEVFETAAEGSRNYAGSPLVSGATGDAAEERSPLLTEPTPQPDVELKLPPMEGFQQMANQRDIKEMLKRLVASDVSVLYQTMMMVENGAATGFMHSMNTVGSLLSNTMQASQLQMQLFDAGPDGAEKKYEYLRSAYKSAAEENKDFWPAALWWASGDRVKQAPTPPPAVKDNPTKTGSNPQDVRDPIQQPAGATAMSVKLSERLFPGATTGGAATDGDLRPKLKDALLKWVGDVEIQATGQGGVVVSTKPVFIQATKFTDAERNNKLASAYEVLRRDTKKDVWKNFNEVMKQYCEFKKQNPNNGVEIFQKRRPSSSIQDTNWKRIFSIDIRPSINLVDQLFKLFLGRKPIEDIDCNSFDTSDGATSMPDSGTPPTSSGTVFDKCEGDTAKTCLRNIIIYRVVEFISESQLNYFYRWLWQGSFGQTERESERLFLAEAFCQNLDLPWPCEPDHTFSVRLENNRMSWVEFSNKLSKFAQGQGGSAVFRPATDNSSLGSAGAVGGVQGP